MGGTWALELEISDSCYESLFSCKESYWSFLTLGSPWVMEIGFPHEVTVINK